MMRCLMVARACAGCRLRDAMCDAWRRGLPGQVLRQRGGKMSKGKVLVIGSNATEIEVHGGKAKTGQYLNETVVPIWAIQAAGYDIVLATPDGTRPHIDAASDSAIHFGGDEARYARAKAFFAEDPAMNGVRRLRAIVDDGLEDYVGVFVPGGQAPVIDLMQDAEVGEILRFVHARKRPTAMLCHGPIASVAAMPAARDFRAALIKGDAAMAKELAKGWQYAGYKMTIFSNAEEEWLEQNILHAKMYFHMVDALKAAGGNVWVSDVDFEPHVVEDRELITGQNPSSDALVGARLVSALERAALHGDHAG
jgi:putative intracellular protease/amidase